MNVYDSDFTWPKGSKWRPAGRAGAAEDHRPAEPAADRRPQQTNARAVLGTVPVRGRQRLTSRAPSGKELYFQALDDRRLAIQSMAVRERTSSPEKRLPTKVATRKSIVRRPIREELRSRCGGPPPKSTQPGRLQSVQFRRVVQPALNRNCVACHKKKRALDLSGPIEGNNGWTRSYNNLAPKYGFYFNVENGSILGGVHGGGRTVGRFGPGRSKLSTTSTPATTAFTFPAEISIALRSGWTATRNSTARTRDTADQARGLIVWPTMD